MGWSRWVGAALVAASSVGFSGRSLASPPPHALGVRLPCIPDGAGPSTGGGVQCGRLSGWFDGRVEWLSAGQVVFVEEGPFHGSPAATGEVQVELDANHDDALFERIYGSTTLPAPSILSAPDLSLRLLLKDADGRLTTVVEQRYTPEAVAFWSRHSEDTIQLASSIDSERAARAAGDERLAATIDSESAARRAADLDTLAAARRFTTDYSYSRSEIDERVASYGIDAAAQQSIAPSSSASVATAPSIVAGSGLRVDRTASGQTSVSLPSDMLDGSAWDKRFVRQAPKGGDTRITSNATVDGELHVKGPLSIDRPDGSVKIGHGSSILELIGADPYVFPVAPRPSIFFSPDPQHELSQSQTQYAAVPMLDAVQLVLTQKPTFTVSSTLGNDPMGNPKCQVLPVYDANGTQIGTQSTCSVTGITSAGTAAFQNTQLEIGPHQSGERAEIHLYTALSDNHYVGFRAPATASSSFLYNLPPAPPPTGQTMLYDAATSNLYWSPLVGDITGRIDQSWVSNLQGHPVSVSAPSDNGIFSFNAGGGTQWEARQYFNISGNGTMGGDLTACGQGTIKGALTVDGNTSIGGTMTIAGATTINNTLETMGASALSQSGGLTSMGGSASIANSLVLAGNFLGNGSQTINGTSLGTANKGLFQQGGNFVFPGALTGSAWNTTSYLATDSTHGLVTNVGLSVSGGGVWAPKLIDSMNSNYYVQPSGFSSLNQLKVSRDGAADCCAAGNYTLALSESAGTAPNHKASIALSNGAVGAVNQDAQLTLNSTAISGGGLSDDHELTLSSTVSALALHVTGFLKSDQGFCIGTDCRTVFPTAGGSGSTNYVPKYTNQSSIGLSQLYDDGLHVGLNTTNPLSRFEVDSTNGDPILAVNAINGYGSIAVQANGANKVSLGYAYNAGNYGLNTVAGDVSLDVNSNFHIATGVSGSSNTTRLYISESGNVGIGTTIPGSLLEVNGNVKVDGTIAGNGSGLTNLNAGAVTGGILAISEGGTGISTPPTAAGQFLRSSAAGTWAVAGLSASDVPPGSGAYIQNINSSASPQSANFNIGGSGYLAGSLGVGLTNPSAKLEVAPGSGAQQWNDVYLRGGFYANESHTIAAWDGFSIIGRMSFEWNGTGRIDFGDLYGSTRATAMSILGVAGEAGRVGIGTTSPDRSLTVANTTGAQYMNVKDGTHELLMGVDSTGGIVSVMTDNDLVLRAGSNSEKVRIEAGGNVGIGTTTPDSLLHLYAPQTNPLIVQSSSGGVGNTSGILFNTFSTVGSANARIAAIDMGSFNGSLAFYTDGDNTNNNGTVERMRIDENGKVGIATTGPQAPLHLYGGGYNTPNVSYISTGQNSLGAMRLSFSAADVLDIGFMSSPYGAWLQSGYNGTAENLLLQPVGGNVGIGTTSPGAPLDVQSTVSYYLCTYYYLSGGGTSSYNNCPQYIALSIRAAGRIIAPEFDATSDAREKNVIGHVEADQALDAIRDVDVVRFNWLYRGGGTHIGVIAQQLGPLVPEAVTVSEGTINGQKVPDYHTVDYQQISALELAGIQALDSRTTDLAAENESLKRRIARLEHLVERLTANAHQ